jgi:DNA-binding beta-propeller fold protein YncE
MAPAGEVDAGVGPTHIVAGPDGRLYVADTQGDAILVFEAADENGEPRLLDRANLPGSPYALAIDAENEMLWVSQTDRNRVVGFELTDLAPKRVVSYPTIQQPNTVAVNPATEVVYVAGRADGELQTIDTRREPGDG